MPKLKFVSKYLSYLNILLESIRQFVKMIGWLVMENNLILFIYLGFLLLRGFLFKLKYSANKQARKQKQQQKVSYSNY